LGLIEASAKAHDQDRALFRNAEALLPSAKAEGSHQTTQVLATLTWVWGRVSMKIGEKHSCSSGGRDSAGDSRVSQALS
jgi:hypothetical protein